MPWPLKETSREHAGHSHGTGNSNGGPTDGALHGLLESAVAASALCKEVVMTEACEALELTAEQLGYLSRAGQHLSVLRTDASRRAHRVLRMLPLRTARTTSTRTAGIHTSSAMITVPCSEPPPPRSRRQRAGVIGCRGVRAGRGRLPEEWIVCQRSAGRLPFAVAGRPSTIR
jgi:hypothetical protein